MTTRDPLDTALRAFLEEEAEAMPLRARSADQMVEVIAQRIRRRSLVPWFLPQSAEEWPRPVRLAWALTVLLALLVVGAALIWAGSTLVRQPPRVITIATDLPLGQPGVHADAIVNAVRLAVLESPDLPGHLEVEVPDEMVTDDSIGGVPDGGLAAANAGRIVAEARNIALIGPFESGIAQVEIPVTNAAGLLHCSPANTAPFLTRGTVADSLRSRPDRPTYVRVVSSDDLLLGRVAAYAFDELAIRSVYVIDGDDPQIADWFAEGFVGRGGRIAGRVPLPDGFSQSGAGGLMQAAAATNPDAVVFTGGPDAAAWLRSASPEAGLGDLPFIGRETVIDGARDSPGSFAARTGTLASGSFGGFPAGFDGEAWTTFRARYQATYGGEPTLFAAAGYACAQVVLAALRELDDPGQDLAGLREAVRAAVTDPAGRFDTVLGPISFDERGDVTPGQATIFGYDPESDAWVIRAVLGG